MRPDARCSIILSAGSYASRMESVHRLTTVRDQRYVNALTGNWRVMQP